MKEINVFDVNKCVFYFCLYIFVIRMLENILFFKFKCNFFLLYMYIKDNVYLKIFF